jgi:16S rRNA U516 pseudouridylate synthase RsuA-like enzyme
MFDSVHAPVQRLVRVRVGTLKLTDLRVGEARPLTHQEMTQLASRARAGGLGPRPSDALPAASADDEE